MCSGTVTVSLYKVSLTNMHRQPTAVKNRKINNLIAANIKSYLRAARQNRNSIGSAGRKFLLTLILKNCGNP
jgi:hypothetical protein